MKAPTTSPRWLPGRSLLAAAAISLGSIGCGDTTDANREALHDALTKQGEANGLDAKQIDCVIEKTDAAISAEEFSAGEPPDDLAARSAKAIGECVDIGDLATGKPGSTEPSR